MAALLISWQSIDLQGEARWKLISGCWGVCGSFQGLENKMAEEDQEGKLVSTLLRRQLFLVIKLSGNSSFLTGCFSVSTLECYSFLLGYYRVLTGFVC